MEQYLEAPFPHKSFKYVFDDTTTMCELAAGPGFAMLRYPLTTHHPQTLTLLDFVLICCAFGSDCYLHTDNVIEQALETTGMLAFLFAYAWVQTALPLKSWCDPPIPSRTLLACDMPPLCTRHPRRLVACSPVVV